MLPAPVFAAQKLGASTDVLRALCHPLRLELFLYIRSQGTVSVQSIYQTLGIEQSLTSQHLRILRRAGLVSTERAGKHVNYQIDAERYDTVSGAISNFLRFEEEYA